MPGVRAPRASTGKAVLSIELTEDVRKLQKALRVLAEPDAPYLRQAMEDSGHDLDSAASSRGPGSIGAAVQFAGVKGNASGLRAVIVVEHPGAASMEFGREIYYRDFNVARRRAVRGQTFRTKEGRVSSRLKATQVRISKGTPFRSSPGQRPRPFIGIVKGNAAIGAVGPRIKERLTDAVQAEWARIASEGAG